MADEDFKFSDNGAPAIFTSQPEKIQRHNISDEELDMLCESKSDLAMEVMLVAIGAGIGTAATAVSSVIRYFSATEADLSFSDFMNIMIFFCALFVGASTFAIYKRKSGRSDSLRTSIRNRTNQKAGAA